MASIRKRDGRPKPYEAVYRDPDGRQRTKSFRRKTDAQRFLVEVEADLARGAYVDPQAGRITFGAFAQDWLAAQAVDGKTAESLASQLNARLLPAFGHLELRAIRPSTVQGWIAEASRELKPSYVKLLLSTLSTILGAAVEDGLIARNAARSRAVRPPSAPREKVVPLTVAEVRAITAAMHPRYAPLVTLAAGCGLRQGEAFGLRVSDVDFLRQRLEVRQQVKHLKGQGTVVAPPKRGKQRSVPLPAAVAEAIAGHLARYPTERDGLVFTSTAGTPLNRGSWNARVWKPAVATAGLEADGLGFHQLRHHYASVLQRRGVASDASHRRMCNRGLALM